MGLAASQARFLGITLRKANCEFQSTQLAQQKLELTDQMTDISQEYANAMNSTKLVWKNDATDGDYGVTYSLLMMPSATNDYNPYMVSTKSGAIVLNSKYAAAAKAAGIGMAGGTASESGRNAFLKSLATPTSGTNDNVITEQTYKVLTGQTSSYKSADVGWHYSAGMGAVPKNKGVADATTLSDLVNDKNIGKQSLDWLQIVKSEIGSTGMTSTEYDAVIQAYTNRTKNAKLAYINAGTFFNGNNYSISNKATVDTIDDVVKNAQNALGENKGTAAADWDWSENPPTLESGDGSAISRVMKKFNDLEHKISHAENENQKARYTKELELLKSGFKYDGNDTTKTVPADGSNVQTSGGKYLSEYEYPIYWAIYDQARAEAKKANQTISWSSSTGDKTIGGKDTEGNTDNRISIDALLQASGNKAVLGSGTYTTTTQDGDKTHKQLTVVVNDIINKDAEDLKGMTIADLLKSNVVLMVKGDEDGSEIEAASKAMLEYVAKIFGYGSIGTGLNVDETSDAALNQALAMTEKKMLQAKNAVKDCGGRNSDSSMKDNDAYNKSNSYNRICINNGGTSAINLSNMVSAFLTYYDNYLRGTESNYVVGKGIDADGTKTSFVTDDPNYTYVTNSSDEITNDEKVADFWNELYNNICAHGWRYDDMVQDSEYFESAIKDGRYSLMALNNDGYFYQQRYNDISYMSEETDNDAISRAEVEYTRKKSEITYKEDSIDIKTKKLDAEIAELTTEMSSVQNIISKSIEKTFSMFSN